MDFLPARFCNMGTVGRNFVRDCLIETACLRRRGRRRRRSSETYNMVNNNVMFVSLWIFSFIAVMCYILMLSAASSRHTRSIRTRAKVSKIIPEEEILSSADVETSFSDYGFNNLSMLRMLKVPRPYFNFTMTPWKVKAETPRFLEDKVVNLSMVVAIKSDYRRSHQREIVRRTWGSIRYYNGFRLEVVFVVGNAKKPEAELDIRRENALYGDILQTDVEEVYGNIGIKALAAMQWVWQHFPDHWIYSSADDDVIPDLRILLDTIEEVKRNFTAEFNVTSSNPYFPLFCGVEYRPYDPPQRAKGKWTVDLKTYPYEHYPPYCLGGFYSMPLKLAVGIYAVSRHFPYFRMDDVWITGFMRLKLCDVLNVTDFVFNQTDINCAISRFTELEFEHAPKVSETDIVQKWRRMESDIMINAKTVLST